MSFTAVILKLPFSALSTVRWERGGEMLQERVSGCSQPRSLPVSQGVAALGGPWTPFPRAPGEEVPISAELRLHRQAGWELGHSARPRGGS